jgi:hypothetical protein
MSVSEELRKVNNGRVGQLLRFGTIKIDYRK